MCNIKGILKCPGTIFFDLIKAGVAVRHKLHDGITTFYCIVSQGFDVFVASGDPRVLEYLVNFYPSLWILVK